MVEVAPFKRALSRDVTACIFHLSNRSQDRWKRNGQVDVQITTPDGRAIALEEVVRRYTEASIQKSLE